MFSLLNQNPPVLKVHCVRIEMNPSKEQKPISFVEMDSPRWIHDALPIFLKPLILSLVRLSLDLGIPPGRFTHSVLFFASHANVSEITFY